MNLKSLAKARMIFFLALKYQTEWKYLMTKREKNVLHNDVCRRNLMSTSVMDFAMFGVSLTC